LLAGTACHDKPPKLRCSEDINTRQLKIECGSIGAYFYRAKIANAMFYFERILPRTHSLAANIGCGSGNLMAIADDVFGL